MSTHRSISPRRSMIALGVVATAAVAVPVAITTTPGSAQAPTSRTITLINRDNANKFIDVAPRGGEEKPPSRGDSYVIYSDLLTPGTKAPAGHGHGVCQVTLPGRRTSALCTFGLALADGNIIVSSVVPFANSTQPGAIVGGTGAYAGARGTATYKDGDTATWELSIEG